MTLYSVRLLWQKKEWRNRYLLWSVYEEKENALNIIDKIIEETEVSY